jgi:hypothetical protein
LAGKLNGRHSLEDLGIDGNTILQWILDKHSVTNKQTLFLVVLYERDVYSRNYMVMYGYKSVRMFIGFNRLRIGFSGTL